MSNIEIIDRRQNKEHHAEPVVIEPEKARGEWIEVVFYPVLVPQPDGSPMLFGRAAGLRGDDVPFVADVMLPPRWDAGYDWTVEARKRLDTFLECNCTSAGPCGVHQMYFKQWPEADMQRCSFIMQSPLPRVMEVIFTAERARQAAKRPNLVVPR